MSQQYPSRIRYEYEQDPETRLQYTHGVWGGINPQGEIEISFYLESDKMPPYSERIIAPTAASATKSPLTMTRSGPSPGISIRVWS